MMQEKISYGLSDEEWNSLLGLPGEEVKKSMPSHHPSERKHHFTAASSTTVIIRNLQTGVGDTSILGSRGGGVF